VQQSSDDFKIWLVEPLSAPVVQQQVELELVELEPVEQKPVEPQLAEQIAEQQIVVEPPEHPRD
jgi:hypothetical protein